MDAALHDAFGNVNGIDSYRGYNAEFMDDLGKWLGPEFAGEYPEQYIRPEYLPKVPVFHLVGGLDKLTRDELDDTDPDDDCAATTWTGMWTARSRSTTSGARNSTSSGRAKCT